MINIQNVTKKYGKTIANDDLNFQVEDGNITVLLGPNGAGKSTIIKCIAGLLRFKGFIDVSGLDNKSIEAKKILGYIPEIPAVYDLLTVGEHLEFIRRAWKIEEDGYTDTLLQRFEMDDKVKKLGRELSKGMQQKLSIICALMHKPKAVVFDEPLVGLDPHAIKELKSMFRELRAEGTAVLISTHMIDSVEDNWDVAHIMMHGKFAETRRIGDETEKSLEELFFDITEGGDR